VTCSDSDGSIYDPNGITGEKLAFIMDLKNVKRGRIEEYAKKFKGSTYKKGARVWDVVAKCDVALPCATQNELDGKNAKDLVKKGVKYVAEGANMPCDLEAHRTCSSSWCGLRSGQGEQRRWCGHQRPGDEPEQPFA
jgi:glutamate dehydrogenase (NADP+)